MAPIVGVHGIAQQQLGRHQLAPVWELALLDGLELAGAAPLLGDAVLLDLAFYGHLFLPPSAPAGAGVKSGSADESWLADIADGDEAFVVSAAADLVGQQALDDAREAVAKGLGALPAWLQAVLAALDRRFGARAGNLFVGELCQARRYLCDAALKAEVDRMVRDRVTDDCRVLIGHSLGSVVAFEFVRQNPDFRLGLLVTLGSPLGARAVRSMMPNPGYGAVRGLPPTIGAWANIRDPRDPVAFAGALTGLWPGVADFTVHNGDDAHSVARYLGKRETGAAVLGGLPQLFA